MVRVESSQIQIYAEASVFKPTWSSMESFADDGLSMEEHLDYQDWEEDERTEFDYYFDVDGVVSLEIHNLKIKRLDDEIAELKKELKTTQATARKLNEMLEKKKEAEE